MAYVLPPLSFPQRKGSEVVLFYWNRQMQRLDTNFFDVRFDRLSNREKEFLRAMAEFPQDKTIAMSDVADRMGRPQSAISPVRSSLIRKGMVYSPAYGGIAYTVPMFADYLRRTMR